MSIPIPKFEIGQKVINVRVAWSEEKKKCPDCLGSAEWKVIAPSGEEWNVPCNTCSVGYYSTGFVSEYADRIKMDTLTIGSIQIDTANSESPIRYMCYETGVGSGTIWYENTLFMTLEEADAFGSKELSRVQGLRQSEELKTRTRNKEKRIYKRSKK